MKPAYTLPDSFYLENYRSVLFESNIPKVFFKQFDRGLLYLDASGIAWPLAGFAIAKMHFKGKNAIFMYLMAGMMIPIFCWTYPNFPGL